jgi:hypothetical protein
MTELNKQRVVKYWNILAKYKAQSFETLLLFRVVNKKEFNAAIRCAIAEVEAIIKALEEYDLVTEAEFIHYGKELIELKQML